MLDDRVSVPLLGLWQGGENSFEPVELDDESRKYIYVRIKNVIKTYKKETGEESVS